MFGTHKPVSSGTHVTQTLTASVYTHSAYGDVDFLVVQVESADVRYTVDGTTDPTSTTGFLLRAGDSDTIPYSMGREPRFLGNGAKLQIQAMAMRNAV